MQRSLASLLAVVISAVLLASCGSEPPVASVAGELDGQEYWSVEVLDNGQPRALVEDTRISLRFSGDQISASAGCNSIAGSYDATDDTLNVTDLLMTEVGCDPVLHSQDDFLVSFLTDAPTISLTGDELLLTTPQITMRLVNTSVANPDRPIVGTVWTVTGFIDDETASSIAVGERGRIEFLANSTLAGFDGCASFSAPVEVRDGSSASATEIDGEMQFGPLDRQIANDCDDAAYSDMFQRLFDTPNATFVIDGTSLTIRNGDGFGVTFGAT